MDQDEETYFWTARKILNTDERNNSAFVRLVAGVSADDPLFSSEQFFETRTGLGKWFEHRMTNGHLVEGAATVGRPATTFDTSRFDPSRLLEGLTSEITQLQLLAMYGADRPPEQAIPGGRLIPSLDGLHWKI
jgi:halogenation protein CepH